MLPFSFVPERNLLSFNRHPFLFLVENSVQSKCVHSSPPCWCRKDESSPTFWQAAGVLNSMRYSHLLGSETCTTSLVEPQRRFTCNEKKNN